MCEKIEGLYASNVRLSNCFECSTIELLARLWRFSTPPGITQRIPLSFIIRTVKFAKNKRDVGDSPTKTIH